MGRPVKLVKKSAQALYVNNAGDHEQLCVFNPDVIRPLAYFEGQRPAD